MDEAVRLALANHPTIAAAQQRLDAAQFHLQAAASGPNPEVQLNPFLGPAAVGGSDEALIVAQVIEISGRRRMRTHVANAHRSGVQAEAAATQRDLVFEVKTAYVELLLAREVVALNEALGQTARQFRDAAQRQFDLGNVPRIQVERADIELARAEQELLRAQSDASVREAELNTWLGRDAATPIALADPLKFQAVEVNEPELWPRALAQRPEVRAAEAEWQARKSQVALTAAERRPDLLVEGRRNEFGSNSQNALRLSLTFPLLDRGAIRLEVKAAQADVREQEALLVQVQNQVRLEVRTALAHVQQARALTERYEQDIVPHTERLVQTIQRGFDAGASTMLDVLDAQRTLRSVQTEYRQAIADYLQALAELEWATGGKVIS
jgi:cobalt-zinc-cadmium efflux system outer membrane protein